jgi:hypothetical protein
MRGEISVGLFYCLNTLKYILSPRMLVRERAAFYRYLENIDSFFCSVASMAVLTGREGGGALRVKTAILATL